MLKRLKAIAVKVLAQCLAVPDLYALEFQAEPEPDTEEPEPTEWVPEAKTFYMPLGITAKSVAHLYLEFNDGDIHLSLWCDGSAHLSSYPYLNGERLEWQTVRYPTGYGVRVNGLHVLTVRQDSVVLFPFVLRLLVKRVMRLKRQNEA